MKKAIVATKVGMTQIFNEDGVLTPVTVLQAGPVYVSQIKTVENDGYEADIFEAGDKIDVTAKTKGHGFQGAIKRHGQSRGPMGHGSKFHRHAGSNGSASDPSKVFKGKKMPGQMGAVQVTIQNLEVVRVDAESNLLLVKGAVPGPKKSTVIIKESVKA